ncbi:mitochondrial solute carrier family 25 (mitochondrial 2-oxodicarboxylate transporter) member 21 [Andalucia godoyi]|uniref:Mitochondrial solute carrier family 25 (Mitochondrial 2-oxodicarboxylate transporter) member 21 n=1 Tax=Andalucia godoyi TaxID=505711 RepID=A0A8K0AI70_ANDGO|nr:mitochondrial solute carrier family 25 (mitochondrial 2-oxodicarboxylate transporter) member 21 [Andalucia godoyi]|eukprot:ANDGO_00712.mRNA.1 mitochondrial solute carrier family 25 (mitochondrial 2-oxodicarboxylate transporter) member 21
MSSSRAPAPVAAPVAAPRRTLTFAEQLFAGGVAGVTEIVCAFPLDVLKTRQQISVGKDVNMFRALGEMVKKEGFKMYRGIAAPIMIEAPKRAIKFSANAQYSPLWMSVLGVSKPTQVSSALAGVSAGLTEAVVIVPFELIKIRMQNPAYQGMYSSTTDCIRKVVAQEGLSALVVGMEATLWRHAAWNGMYFGSIFAVKARLPEARSKGAKLWWDFVAGSVAGTLGTMLNTPFDVVKSRRQNALKGGDKLKYNWTLPAVATIAQEEGIAALYKGFGAKVARLGPGGGVLLLVFNVISDFLTAPKHH